MRVNALEANIGEYYYFYTSKNFKMIIKIEKITKCYSQIELGIFNSFHYKFWFLPFQGEPGSTSFKSGDYMSNCQIELIDDIMRLKILLCEK